MNRKTVKQLDGILKHMKSLIKEDKKIKEHVIEFISFYSSENEILKEITKQKKLYIQKKLFDDGYILPFNTDIINKLGVELGHFKITPEGNEFISNGGYTKVYRNECLKNGLLFLSGIVGLVSIIKDFF